MHNSRPIIKKPDFFIVGTAKAGTTTLYKQFSAHPGIFMSPIKEPNYFSSDIDINLFSESYRKNTFLNTEAYFAQYPLQPLQLTFVRKPEHYRALFKDANEALAGEASTSYLYSAVAAKNIYQFNPHAKIIAILRNPVERAYSHYLMALKYGHVKTDFYTALQKDIQRGEKGWGRSELFLELGLYYNQLKRYFNIFPAQQILILEFEELETNMQKALNRCFRFLNLPEREVDVQQQANKGEKPRAAGLNKWLVDTGIKHFVKGFLPDGMHEYAKKLMYTGNAGAVPRQAKELLLYHYHTDIKKTSVLIQKDLTHWLS